MEISPFISASHSSVRDSSSSSPVFRAWEKSSTYPTTPKTPDGMGLHSKDEFGHGGEGGYFEDEIAWSGRRDDAWRWNSRLDVVSEDIGRRMEGGFLEQCRSEHCFFGCGGDCVPTNGYIRDYEGHTGEREYDLDAPRSRLIEGTHDRVLERYYGVESPRASQESSK